jgi:hypothetical protein
MTCPPSHPYLEWLSIALDLGSAVFGMLGTYYMAKRYANNFWSGMFFAVAALCMYARGKGKQVAAFYRSRDNANSDIKDIPSETALGLNLLFLAFFLQLAKIAVAIASKLL